MTHLSTLTLHQLRYGELSGGALDRVRGHVDSCDLCAGRLRAQEHERAAFAASPVPDAIRTAARPPARTSWFAWLAPFATAAALMVAVRGVRTAEDTAPDVVVAETQARGELPSVEVWVRDGGRSRALRDGERVGAGSVVQLKYDPHGASAIAIAGRDGSGMVEVYTTAAPTGIGLVNAPFALTLDDAPGDQELFVVGSVIPLDEGAVRLAVTGGVPGAKVARVRLAR